MRFEFNCEGQIAIYASPVEGARGRTTTGDGVAGEGELLHSRFAGEAVAGQRVPVRDEPRIDPEAMKLTRQHVSYELDNLVSTLNCPEKPEKDNDAFLLGLHEKFWHAFAPSLAQLLERAGVARARLEWSAGTTPRKCRRCMESAHAEHRAKVNARFGRYYNHAVQCDIFFLWDRTFIILVGECTRCKFASVLEGKS